MNVEDYVPVLPSKELLSEFIEELYKESKGDCASILSTISNLLEGEIEESISKIREGRSYGELTRSELLNVLILKGFRDLLKLYDDLLKGVKNGKLDEETKRDVIIALDPILAIIRLAGTPLLQERLLEALGNEPKVKVSVTDRSEA